MSNKKPSLMRAVPDATALQQAQQIWMILVSFVMNKTDSVGNKKSLKDISYAPPATITYGELALKMGYKDKRAGHGLGYPLGILAVLCINSKLPAINTIVVNQETGMPGESVLFHGDLEAEQCAIFKNENWFAYRIPTLEELDIASTQIPLEMKKQFQENVR